MKILFLTGDRAEYDIQFPVITAFDRDPDFSAAIAVAGTHLVERFGHSVREIEKDGFNIVARINNLPETDEPVSRAKAAAIEQLEFAEIVSAQEPDFLCVMGDREDTIAGATVGVYAQVPVIHIGGGDRADDGNSDNPIRDAVTKLSHIHLAASEQSHDRVIALGEAPWRVCNIGAPGLDRLKSVEQLEDSVFWRRLGVAEPSGPFVVMIQHPLLPEHAKAGEQLIETLEAILAVGVPAFISRPNSDPGNVAMIKTLEEYCKTHPTLHLFGNLGRVEFVNLMRRCHAMVGNSSAGIIEAPFLKLPAVNVGRRQLGREHAENVVFTDHDRHEIKRALSEALFDNQRRQAVAAASNPYGDGTAGEKALAFVRSLSGNPERLLRKIQTAIP